MNLNNRIKKLERRDGDASECPLCLGMPGPYLRVEFQNGDEPVEMGRCRCGGTGVKRMRMYLLPSREFFDAV